MRHSRVALGAIAFLAVGCPKKNVPTAPIVGWHKEAEGWTFEGRTIAARGPGRARFRPEKGEIRDHYLDGYPEELRDLVKQHNGGSGAYPVGDWKVLGDADGEGATLDVEAVAGDATIGVDADGEATIDVGCDEGDATIDVGTDAGDVAGGATIGVGTDDGDATIDVTPRGPDGRAAAGDGGSEHTLSVRFDADAPDDGTMTVSSGSAGLSGVQATLTQHVADFQSSRTAPTTPMRPSGTCEDLTGRLIGGKYQVLGVLGQGGFGVEVTPLAVHLGKHDHAVQALRAPAVLHEISREPVEQLRM